MKRRTNKKDEVNIQENKKEVNKSNVEETGKENKERLKDLFALEMFSEVIVKNPVLVSTIGLCPVVAICTSLKFALVLTFITYLTMIFSQVLSSLIFKRFEQWIRIAMYSLSGMAIIAPAMIVMQKLLPENMIAMGLYLPLLVINPLITRQCERVAVKGTVKQSFVNAISCATGYAIVLIITGFAREILANGAIWEYTIFENPPLPSFTNPFAGFLVLGLLAALLRVYFKKIDPQYAEELSVHSRSSIEKSKSKKQNSRAQSLITEYEKNRNIAMKKEQDKAEILTEKEIKKQSKKQEEIKALNDKKEEVAMENDIDSDKLNNVHEQEIEKNKKNIKKSPVQEFKEIPKSDYSSEKSGQIDTEIINTILQEYKTNSKELSGKNKPKSKPKRKYTSKELEKLMSMNIEDLMDMTTSYNGKDKNTPKTSANKENQEVPEE